MAQLSIAVAPMHDLLLRNCRFLDLDLLPDWPKITDRSFRANEDARVRSKARIKAAEWLLFRLYERWDPMEARAKLAQYFPALEPIQSIKLRSTIFTLLSRLKQQGILTDCTLRRSLLDECQGPRFEDLLLAFSTLVLRKQIAGDDSPASSAPNSTIEADNLPHNASQLQPLILANSHALSKVLKQRQLDRARIQGLEAYILFKDLSLQESIATDTEKLSHAEQELAKVGIDAKDMKRKLRHHAPHNESWLSIALSGEPDADRDGMLEESFDSLWQKTITGEDFQQHAPTPTGMLQELGEQFKTQQTRLQRWRDFQQQAAQRHAKFIVPKTPVETPRKTPRAGLQKSLVRGSRKQSFNAAPRAMSPIKRPSTTIEGMTPIALKVAQPALTVESAESSTPTPGLNRTRSLAPPRRSPERQHTTPTALKRATSTRQSSRPVLQHEDKILRRATGRLDQRSEDRGSLVIEKPAGPSISSNIIERKLSADEGGPVSGLADRARASTATASGRRESATSCDDVHHRAMNSSNASKSSERPRGPPVSLSSRTATSLAQLANPADETNQPRTPRPTHRRAQSHNPRPGSVAQTDTQGDVEAPPFSAARVRDTPGRTARDGIGLAHQVEDDQGPRTPSGQLYQMLDAESVFKPRKRLGRSPPPSAGG